MRKFIIFFGLCLVMLSGCAAGNLNYEKYLGAVEKANKFQKPTFKIECPEAGCKFTSLEYFDPRDKIAIQQKLPHPAWNLVAQGMKYATIGYGLYTFSDLMTTAIEGAGTVYRDSFNTTAGNYTPIRISADRGRIGSTNPRIGDDNRWNYDRSFNDDHHSVVTHPRPEPKPKPEK